MPGTKRKYYKRKSKVPFSKYSVGSKFASQEARFSAAVTRLTMGAKQLPPFPQIFELTGPAASPSGGTMATNGGGVLVDHVPLGATGFSALPDWGFIGGLYDMFRVIGFSIEFFPVTQATSVSTLAYAPVVIVYDPDQFSTNLSSFNGGTEYETKKIWDLRNHQRFTVKVPKFVSFNQTVTSFQIDSDGFIDTLAVGNVAWGEVAWYGQMQTLSSTYGFFITKFLIAAKYRK